MAEPYLRIVRGDATAEEIAAIVATLTAAAGAAAAHRAQERRAPSPGWNSRARLLRSPVHPAPGGWIRSARP